MTSIGNLGLSPWQPAPARRPQRTVAAPPEPPAPPAVPRYGDSRRVDLPRPVGWRDTAATTDSDTWSGRQALARYREIQAIPEGESGEWLGRIDARV